MSAQSCGCDPEENHVCLRHTEIETPVNISTPFISIDGLRGWFDVPPAEQRATDPTTGGEKGRKLAAFSLLPYDALWAVAEHFGVGAKKYAARNWEKGYPHSWTVDALMRHLTAYLEGEDRDPETGSLHVTAVAWHALVLVAFTLRKVGTDDRRKS